MGSNSSKAGEQIVANVLLLKALQQSKCQLKSEINKIKIKRNHFAHNSTTKDSREVAVKINSTSQKIHESSQRLTMIQTNPQKSSSVHTLARSLDQNTLLGSVNEIESSLCRDLESQLQHSEELRARLAQLKETLQRKRKAVEATGKNRRNASGVMEKSDRLQDVSILDGFFKESPDGKVSNNKSPHKFRVFSVSTLDSMYDYLDQSIIKHHPNRLIRESISPALGTEKTKKSLEDSSKNVQIYTQLSKTALNLRSKLLLKADLETDIACARRFFIEKLNNSRTSLALFSDQMMNELHDDTYESSSLQTLLQKEAILRKELENEYKQQKFLKNISKIGKNFNDFQTKQLDLLEQRISRSIEFLY